MSKKRELSEKLYKYFKESKDKTDWEIIDGLVRLLTNAERDSRFLRYD